MDSNSGLAIPRSILEIDFPVTPMCSATTMSSLVGPMNLILLRSKEKESSWRSCSKRWRLEKDTRLQSMCEELISSSWEKNHMENFDYTISISQLGEQLTLNQWVLGSSPRWCTKGKPYGNVGLFSYVQLLGKLYPVQTGTRTARARRLLWRAQDRARVPPWPDWSERGLQPRTVAPKDACG